MSHISISDRDVLFAIRAGFGDATLRDFPDAVGWADLAYAPHLSRSVIQSRITADFGPGRMHTISLPKGIGKGYRRMSLMDPFDEIAMRIVVGRMVTLVDAAMGDEVSSYRVLATDQGWRVRDRRYTSIERRSELEVYCSSPGLAGVGMLDIKNFYPSIDADILCSELARIGCNSDAVDGLKWLLAGLTKWGLQGLPVGPDSSGVVANCYLLPLDKALEGTSYRFSRFSDDVRVWDVSWSAWDRVVDVTSEALANLGLRLNRDKLRHLSDRDEILSLTNPDLMAISSQLNAGASNSVQCLYEMFDAEVDKAAPSSERINFLLGVLGNRSDNFAISRLMDAPSLVDSSPSRWGTYIRKLRSVGKVDVDWLADAALLSVKTNSPAGWHYMGAIASSGRLGKEVGDKFFELASGVNLPSSTENAVGVPLRSKAAEAWMSSDSYRPSRAVEAALSVGDPQQRRSLALTLRRDNSSRHVAKWADKLGSNSGDCRPTASWIKNGCPVEKYGK